MEKGLNGKAFPEAVDVCVCVCVYIYMSHALPSVCVYICYTPFLACESLSVDLLSLNWMILGEIYTY